MIDLNAFLPYQFSQLADVVSHSVATVYESRLGISRDDWRVLVAVNQARHMRATDIAQHTALDKMQVSRAIARLEKKGFLSRTADTDDKRQQILAVTPAGQAAYREVSPLMMARNDYLLQDLTPAEREVLQRYLDQVLNRAQQLVARG
ncbi:DNA-binding MarR family transcriptional regulator [Advenella incenata]|jgi:DNA-binding MarR family transcriptional regulator|uniref:DNA-binding MarR family transcriptional regulator n=1 Tax=Advenella incenata TaxID=267800 RepID=A0A4Q7VRV9_9BURK|nr:MarR family transcriptional regulator [Advenella incenata]RZT98978.1 DNA-binding MarR family transcriptional regulator [Advenella incenata]